jgi:transposase
MSISLLNRGFGIPSGYEYKRTTYQAGQISFTIHKPIDKCQCSACGSTDVDPRGTITRSLRTVPLGKKIIEIEVVINRPECNACGAIRQEHLSFAEERRTYTYAFERYVLELSKRMTIKDVAIYAQTSWDIVKDIQRRYLKRKFGKPRLKHLKYIAIDEINIGHGYKFLTIVMDLEEGVIVYVGDGKSAESLDPFWRRLRRYKANIRAVAIDMSPAYIGAVQKNLPQADIVFDHFHLVKLLNEKLSDLRRDLFRELKGAMHKQVLKGTRWLLLKNPENLDESKNEKARLEEALKLNQPLATAYYMKEDFRQIWMQENKKKAAQFLKDWMARAQASGIQMLKKFASTLASVRTGILAYYDHFLSSGPLEGTNNKIKTMNKQAYGFRDVEFFKLKIYALHETKYALVG